MTIFGGKKEKNQISIVYVKGVQRIGTLPFQFYGGRCNYSNKTIHLCYPQSAQNLCH